MCVWEKERMGGMARSSGSSRAPWPSGRGALAWELLPCSGSSGWGAPASAAARKHWPWLWSQVAVVVCPGCTALAVALWPWQ